MFLKLNIIIVFKTKGKQYNANVALHIKGTSSRKVNSIKFLGVEIDSKLSWHEHIGSMRKKIAKGVGILCKARKVLNVSTLLTLYNSFILPYMTYGIEVWGSANDCYINDVVTLQKKIIRIMCSKQSGDHTAPLFKSLKILPYPKLH